MRLENNVLFASCKFLIAASNSILSYMNVIFYSAPYSNKLVSVTVDTHIAGMAVAVSQKLALLRIALELGSSTDRLFDKRKDEELLADLLIV